MQNHYVTKPECQSWSNIRFEEKTSSDIAAADDVFGID